MQKLVVTIGLPASGKTTWTNDTIKNNSDFVNVNRDDLRLLLVGRSRYNKFTKWRESIVTKLSVEAVYAALGEGKSVIISDTNLDPNRNENWKGIARDYGVQYEEKLFTDVPLGVCLDRDAKREFPVGTKVIMGMFNKYRDIYWPKPKRYAHMPNAYIVDVDGTIAHMHNRGPFDWKKVGQDEPIEDVINVIQQLAADKNNRIIICSGRDGSCEQETRQWLVDNKVPFDAFFIRPAGDNRKDYYIKEEIYHNHIEGNYNVLGVFDDRDQVVHLWRQLGLQVFQTNYGNF